MSPNLTSLIGELVAAKLIAHSGSLSTLAKYPASTIQILGAEKALFRALKQKSKTPKYGLLYNTSFIGRAMGKSKGKISRYLANKCAMAARLDHFLINVIFQLIIANKCIRRKAKRTSWKKASCRRITNVRRSWKKWRFDGIDHGRTKRRKSLFWLRSAIQKITQEEKEEIKS